MSLSRLRPLVAGAALAVLLTGCGDDTRASTASGDTGAPGADAGVRAAMPGTFGEIAAVDGEVLQVRNQMTGQVAVTLTDATTVTAQAAAALADLTQGVCVVVRSGDNADSGTANAVTAASVAVSPAGEDGCAGGVGGPGGPGGGQRPTDLPSDLPTDLPSRAPGGGRGGFGTAGQVTSVSDAGFVVDGPNGSVTVTVVADTSYTKQVPSEASTLTIGRCVRVQGDADDTGAVTATSVQVSDKVDDQCGL